MSDRFRPVTKESPCPACGHGDWCAWEKENGGPPRLRCQRPAEAKTPPGMWKSGEFADHLGFTLDRDDAGRPKMRPKLPPKQPPVKVSQVDVEAACALWRNVAAGTAHERLAASLGVSPVAVAMMGAGIAEEVELADLGTKSFGECWTHPMRNALGQAVGVRLCPCDGSGKFQLRGAATGLFLREDWYRWLTWPMQRKTVWIVEGRSDPMAMLTLDPEAAVIGRPNNAMMPDETAAHCKYLGYSHAVIIPDNDAEKEAAQEQTAKGARDLRDALVGVGVKTAIVVPGSHADLRAYVKAGGTLGKLQQAARDAEWTPGAVVSDKVRLAGPDEPAPVAPPEQPQED